MEKINVAELLKECPKGMELDCTMYENVYFGGLSEHKSDVYPITINIIDDKNNEHDMYLTKEGCWSPHLHAKCIIFPKGKTTWEGFHRPFKDGDIIRVRDEYSDATFNYVAILKQIEKGGQIYSHCFYNYEAAEFSTDDYLYDVYSIRFATEEEKAKLFDAIKENGYKWNSETKTLEKLPKFKVGDRVRLKLKPDYVYTIHSLAWDDNKRLAYRFLPNNDKHLILVSLNTQDNYELVPNKFDITTLVPFESRVLVRDTESQKWSPAMWGFYDSDSQDYQYKLVGVIARYCIPYKGNQHLLGTTNDCDEYFKTWK